MTTTVFTDGACLGNPGPGGWAWAVPRGRFASGSEVHTTNQRMEIKAVLEAAQALAGPLEIVSDSTYVVNCFRDRWWEAWMARGWVNSAKKPVANRDLWEPLIEAVRADPGRVAFRWVKGHSGDISNDLVDRLAVDAARTQEGRTGTGTPTDLGAADDPTGSARGPGATGADPRLPVGHLVAVTGHRPPALGGYDDNPVAARVRNQLAEILAAKRQLQPDLVVLTGLGLGAEQLAAEAAVAAGVGFVAVLPYPDPDAVWPSEAKQRFRQLLEAAMSTIVVQDKKPATKALAGAALRRRDTWIARHAAEAVVVWDGEDDAVGRAVRALQDALGGDDVWVIPPPDPDPVPTPEG
ncbi:MAG TPA: ribonuclease H [Acidimicrobiales bacterium]|nr:ribonuclease H [Acidimicrobiales bacterium]